MGWAGWVQDTAVRAAMGLTSVRASGRRTPLTTRHAQTPQAPRDDSQALHGQGRCHRNRHCLPHPPTTALLERSGQRQRCYRRHLRRLRLRLRRRLIRTVCCPRRRSVGHLLDRRARHIKAQSTSPPAVPPRSLEALRLCSTTTRPCPSEARRLRSRYAKLRYFRFCWLAWQSSAPSLARGHCCCLLVGLPLPRSGAGASDSSARFVGVAVASPASTKSSLAEQRHRVRRPSSGRQSAAVGKLTDTTSLSSGKVAEHATWTKHTEQAVRAVGIIIIWHGK